MFIPALLVLSAAFLLRSLGAARLDRWNIAAPVLMVVLGAASGLTVAPDALAGIFNTEIAQHVAEIILAMLLFVDATEIRGGRLWGRSPGLVARVLLIAMPLSIVLAVLLGMALLPDLSWPLLLLIACIVIPSDFAAAERVVRDPGLPVPVRSVLNLESGYNDGLVSPVFLFALILARTDNQKNTPEDALATAVPFAIKAILMGTAAGALIGFLLVLAIRAGWTSPQGRRVVVLTTPLLAYAATVAIDGNGFVASFVCGIAFRYVFRGSAAAYVRKAPHRARAVLTGPAADLQLLEEVTGLLTMGMWFVIGAISVLVVKVGVSWQEAVFCLAALTVLRILPVMLSLVRSELSGRDRFLVGALGPRGTTSIVFGLIALNGLSTGDEDIVLIITVVCVLGSVLLHGIGSGPLTNRLGAARRR